MSAETLLAGVREAVNALRSYECQPDEIADSVADCRSLEVTLGEWRKRQEAKVDRSTRVEPGDRVDPGQRAGAPSVVGQRWEMVPQTRIERTWNTSAILSSFSEALGSRTLAGALAWLVDREAVRVQWLISKLEPAASEAGVKLTRQKGEVEEGDLDGPMIGEVRVPNGFLRVPLKGD
jgi:hypothetical protein